MISELGQRHHLSTDGIRQRFEQSEIEYYFAISIQRLTLVSLADSFHPSFRLSINGCRSGCSASRQSEAALTRTIKFH
ncbi:hypothetical protein TNCV_3531561 [Trichonephila clavipes]|nr:hypothetical protein TNCV_3531561 [Trichonephila clavipes]